MTFLLSGIEGSTRLWEAYAQEMARAVPAHYAAVRRGGHARANYSKMTSPPAPRRRHAAEGLVEMVALIAQMQAGGSPNGKKDVLKTFPEMQLPLAGLSR